MPADPSALGYALTRLPDGTIRQVSPLTGTAVWTVPGRAHRPLAPTAPADPLPEHGRDRICAFCSGRMLDTPPEKARLVWQVNDTTPAGNAPAGNASAGNTPAGTTGAGTPRQEPWRILRHLPAEALTATQAQFRRVPNLFEILPLAYWQANHGCEVEPTVRDRAAAYVASSAGRAHVLGVLRSRMRAAGAPAEAVALEPESALLSHALELFAGCNDVVIARRHHVDGAVLDDELASAGDLTPHEHHAFTEFTIDALRDLHAGNEFARYVAVFQNWMRPAGASFDHLHKQLVAIDEYGPQMAREEQFLRADVDLFSTAIVDPAARAGLLVARTDHAVALAGVGHRYPTLEVYSTAAGVPPWEHSVEARRSFSDMLHACHAATGRLVPTNEEWHYRPPRSHLPMPWRVNLKWRVSVLAGFEGGTRIHVNTIDPFTLRDRVVANLAALREAGRIAPMALGDECGTDAGILGYARGS